MKLVLGVKVFGDGNILGLGLFVEKLSDEERSYLIFL
jgi:hypothetical protein